MAPINFASFSGTITHIEDFPSYPLGENNGCSKFISVQNNEGAVVNFIAAPATYFLNQEIVRVGDLVTGYYDGDAPAILIYPPQYPALVMIKETQNRQVKVDYFDERLISSDGALQLHLTPEVPIRITNGQPFTNNPAGKNLIVSYGPATKSIPARTTPYEVIVFCR